MLCLTKLLVLLSEFPLERVSSEENLTLNAADYSSGVKPVPSDSGRYSYPRDPGAVDVKIPIVGIP